MATPGDAELVAAARDGDAAGLGVLMERHRAGMRAVAVSLLGWGPDADDAVQDAMLVALRRLDGLRDPAAAGAWLRAITRNAARARLRSCGREARLPVDTPSPEPTPEQAVEEHALRNWVWAALEHLTEPLQLPVLLRYFTDARSYDQIAAVCDVPVGTVRSRLHEARRRLTDHLRQTSATAHDDAVGRAADRGREAEDLLASAPRGEFPATLAALAAPDLLLVGPQGQRGRGPDLLTSIMNSDLAAGVRQRPVRVTAGGSVTILECDLLSPAWDPYHCPPGVLWLIRTDGGRMTRISLHHPSPRGAAL
ncbi:MAG TPA: sigma-70 family RNA polymerase sigma factor [Micromonosporaceae bacterium]|nr:sigma-70 family RNA polymerase sigma factor [Micromonosporaceae bacterium]